MSACCLWSPSIPSANPGTYLDTWICQKPQAHFPNRLPSLVELRPEHYGWLMDNGPLWWHAHWSGSDWGDWSHCGHLSWMSTHTKVISYDVNGPISFCCLKNVLSITSLSVFLFYLAFCYENIRLLWIFAVFYSNVRIAKSWWLHASLILNDNIHNAPHLPHMWGTVRHEKTTALLILAQDWFWHSALWLWSKNSLVCF